MCQRRNNKADMTIREQIEDIKEDFCGTHCKYLAEAKVRATEARFTLTIDEPRDRQNELSEIQHELLRHCRKCPLTRL